MGDARPAECLNLTYPTCTTQADVKGWLLWMTGYVNQRLIDAK